ncbi:MAG: (2Fe-2S)-binding protein [Bacillota bacterium]
MKDEDVIICRCEDITLADLRAVLRDGHTDFEEIKRILRCTMGPCQGRTCRDLILREIAAFRGVTVEEVEVPTYRPPTTPIKLRELKAAYDEREGTENHG